MQKSNGFIQRIFTQTCTTTQLFKSRAVDKNDDDDDNEDSADDRQDDNKLVEVVSMCFRLSR